MHIGSSRKPRPRDYLPKAIGDVHRGLLRLNVPG
jgi:hypothetical protein